MDTRSKFVSDHRAQISSRCEASVLFLPEDREAFILNVAIHIDQPLVQEATTQTEMLQPQELLAVPPHLRDLCPATETMSVLQPLPPKG